jgi:hypothetical protein
MGNEYGYQKGGDGKAFWLTLLVIVLLAFKSDDDDLITYLNKLSRLGLKYSWRSAAGFSIFIYGSRWQEVRGR